MRFSLAINLERMDPADDMRAVADHVLEMVQMADAAGFDTAWAAEHHAIEMTIAPGLLARIYQMRWNIEKVYDAVKNKFHEQKAWASSPTAKSMQAHFVCLTHNLMVLQEHHLSTEEGVTNTCEIKRKAKRLDKERRLLAAKNEVLPVLLEAFQRLTQRSVKYIRWLRAYLFTEAPWAVVVLALRHSYDVF